VQISSIPTDAIAFARHRADMQGADLDLSAYPAVHSIGATPRTIRAHTGAREFGSFGVALARRDPTARRLGDVVRRARARDAVTQTARTTPRLIALRSAAEEQQTRFTDRLTTIVLVALTLWFGLPTALAMIAGSL
jgi:hypothetical protein